MIQDNVASVSGANELKDSGTLILDQLASWYNTFIKMLPNLGIAIIVLILAYVVSKYIDRGVRKLLKNKVSQASVRRLAGKAIAIIVVLGGIFIAMSVLDLNNVVQGIIAGAGVSGLVIGLALQGSLSNIVSGIILSFRKQVKVGDWIETSDFSGQVMEIQLDKFILKQADNNIAIIPNKTIIESPMLNYSLTNRMRIVLECGVGYSSNLDQVKKIAIEAIADQYQQEDSEEIEFFYTEFGGSSINFMLRFWTDATKAKDKHQALSNAVILVKKAFDKNDINIPFPIRTLQFDNHLNINKPE